MKTIHNNISKWLLGLVLPLGGVASGTLCSSCSDFLEVEPQNLITIDQFWNEENDVESVILGCYSYMADNDYLSRVMIWGEFRSENIVSYSSTIDQDKNLEKILDENLTANNGYTSWTAFYNVINRCNTVIDHAEEVAANDPSYTQSEMRAHIAEAVALRSLSYFYLIRTFRDVPYNNETYYDDGQTLALAATPFNVVLDSLITALEGVVGDAIETYPEANDLKRYYNTGRITKWAIYAMLSEMYLWKEDYQNCIKYADLVIAQKRKEAKEDDISADYSYTNNYPLIWCGYPGVTNYYGYSFNKIFVTGNSQESIFELNYEKNNDNRLSNKPVSNFFGNDGRNPFCNASDYVLSDMGSTTPAVFANKYDGRGYESLYYTKTGDATRINKYVTSSSIQMYGTSSAVVSFGSDYTIFGSPYPTVGNDFASRNKSNYIIYRLSDIMLLEAEAYAQLIGENGLQTAQDSAYRDSAFQLVDAVNRRSLYVPDTTSSSSYAAYRLIKSDYQTRLSMTNLVIEERERELIFEGKRWFDLVRRSRRDGDTSYMREKVKQKSASKASVIESQLQKMDRIYWPYNLDETKANGNLVQNPAFGSGESSSLEKTAN